MILRYELEQALLAGDLQPQHLPGAWNDGMQDILGITPPSDREGVLQDIHWFDGALGYFPTYTLGAMTAAQLFVAAHEQLPDLETWLSKGDFSSLLSWLRQHVHSLGSRFTSRELLMEATGKDLDVNIYKQHLQQRYLP